MLLSQLWPIPRGVPSWRGSPWGKRPSRNWRNPFEMTQPAISQHLKVLEEAGLIVQRVDGTKRPRRLAKAGIEAMDQWLAMLRKALEKNYERLDEVLAAMNEPTTKGKKR